MNTLNLFLGSDCVPQIGDKLIIPKSIVDHVGVVIPGGVIHNNPTHGEHATSIAEFTSGQPYRIEKTGANPMLVMQRANRILRSPKRYALLDRNCEHTANEVVEGKPRSPQLLAAVAIVAVCAVVAYLIGSSARNA